MLVVIVLAMVLGGMNAVWVRHAGKWPRVEQGGISWDEVRAMDSVIWVDTRGARDYARGHVAGSVHLPPEAWHEQLGALLERVTGEETIVCYCNPGCGSAHAMARRLRELGMERVLVLEGGYREELLTTNGH